MDFFQFLAVVSKAIMYILYKVFYRPMFSFLLDKYLGLELRDQRVDVYLILSVSTRHFPSVYWCMFYQPGVSCCSSTSLPMFAVASLVSF